VLYQLSYVGVSSDLPDSPPAESNSGLRGGCKILVGRCLEASVADVRRAHAYQRELAAWHASGVTFAVFSSVADAGSHYFVLLVIRATAVSHLEPPVGCESARRRVHIHPRQPAKYQVDQHSGRCSAS
jgi:hypothetical protein